MNLVRSALHLAWMALTLVPWFIVVLIAGFFVSSTRLYWICVGWLRSAVKAGHLLLGIRNRVTGYENLPLDSAEPVVLLVKHQSAWETFCMPTLIPRPLAYVFKRELLRIPLFGWGMARLDMIHIDRDRPLAAFSKVVQQGKRLLGQGMWVIMFPEGTRIPRGEKGVYRSSGTRLAIECGASVIPVAVTSAKCWPPKAFIKRPGVVDISIGPPIPSTGRRPDELMREVEAWIEAEMLRLDPEAYPSGQARLSRQRPEGG